MEGRVLHDARGTSYGKAVSGWSTMSWRIADRHYGGSQGCHFAVGNDVWPIGSDGDPMEALTVFLRKLETTWNWRVSKFAFMAFSELRISELQGTAFTMAILLLKWGTKHF
jgi:hypothetical protein